MANNSLRRAFNDLDLSKKDKDQLIPAVLGFTIQGRETVEVPARPGYVYARIRSNTNELVQVFNDKVSPVYDLPVLLMRDSNNPTRYKVDGRDVGRYENWGSSTTYLPRHANTHSFNAETGGGGDIVWVYGEQFMPLAVVPSGSYGSSNVLLGRTTLALNDIWTRVGGTGTASLVSYNPTGSNARMVLVSLNDVGNPQLTAGSYFDATLTGTSQILGYLPSTPANSIPLAGIRLVSGTSSIVWDNIYDLRPFLNGGSGGAPASHATQHEHGGSDPLTRELIDHTTSILRYDAGGDTYVEYAASNANLATALADIGSNDVIYLPTFSFEGTFTITGSFSNITIIGRGFTKTSISNYAGNPAVSIFCSGTTIEDVNIYVEGSQTGTVSALYTRSSYLYYRDISVFAYNDNGPVLALDNTSAIQEFYGYCYLDAFNAVSGSYVKPVALDPYTPYMTPDPITEDIGISTLYIGVGVGQNRTKINSQGITPFGAASIRPRYSTIDVSNPPTDAELDAAFGTPATVGKGYMVLINDADGGSNEYLVLSDGTSWWHVALTKST